MATDHFCLKWNNFHSSILSALESLQSSEDLVDVTLMCEGRNVKAHKVILSACSPYFRNLFKETPCQHPIIILKDVLHCDLIAILHFMYQGEVLIQQDGLASFLKTAELLQVSGLAGSTPGVEENLLMPPNSAPPTPPLVPAPIASPSSPSPPPPPRPPVHKSKTDTQSKQSASTKQGTQSKQAHAKQAEKENSPKKDEKQSSRVEADTEPMQSCSYQAVPETVVIKTESVDHFEQMEYDMIAQESLETPEPSTEEQSILERSLKAQGMSPHSSKLYTMDLSIGSQISTLPLPSPNQSALSPHSELMRNPCVAPLVLVTKNNTELSKDSGKRKIKPALEPIPSNKKMFIKSILPKVEFKTKDTKSEHSPPRGELAHGAQFGKCPHCTKVYSNQSALKYHVRLVHSDMLNMFCCHLCPESFEYRESYKAHMWEKHSVRN